MSFETWNYSKHVLLFEIIIVVRVISMVNVSSFIINMAGCPENLTLFLAFFHSSLYPVQSRTETNFLYKAILVNDHQNLFMAFISLSVVLLHVAISFSLLGLVQCCFFCWLRGSIWARFLFISIGVSYTPGLALFAVDALLCAALWFYDAVQLKLPFCSQFILMSYQSFLFSVLFFQR